MSKLHIFIDGSWFFRTCQAKSTLAKKTEFPEQHFHPDFERLNASLLTYAQKMGIQCDGIGERHMFLSIFDTSQQLSDKDQLVESMQDTIASIDRGVEARNGFAEAALKANYSNKAILRPVITKHHVEAYAERRYQEKRVDTSLVALLVYSALTNKDDFHIIITGDSDIIPAIELISPKHTENIMIATTNPNATDANDIRTSSDFNNIKLKVAPYYLEDRAVEFIAGKTLYKCSKCDCICRRSKPITSNKPKLCKQCHEKAKRKKEE